MLNKIINQSNQKDMKYQNKNTKQSKMSNQIKYKSHTSINKVDCPNKSSPLKSKVKLNLKDLN